MRRTLPVALLGVVALSACATAPEMAGPPDFTPVPTQPSIRAGLYADCIAQSIANGAYGRASDGDADLILFRCADAPARAFYDGLAARSAAVGSQVQVDGLTLRSTNAVQRDLFGVDYCTTDGVGGYDCVISLNAGGFLAEDD